MSFTPNKKPIVYVYIAGPYTEGDQLVNIRRALEAAERLFAWKLVPFIPHLSGFWHFLNPHTHEEWLRYDRAWLVLCDAILRLPGPSRGADDEVANARLLDLPVFESIADIIEANAIMGKA